MSVFSAGLHHQHWSNSSIHPLFFNSTGIISALLMLPSAALKGFTDKRTASLEIPLNQINSRCASLRNDHEERAGGSSGGPSAGRPRQQGYWPKKGGEGMGWSHHAAISVKLDSVMDTGAFNLKGCLGLSGQAVWFLLMLWMFFRPHELTSRTDALRSVTFGTEIWLCWLNNSPTVGFERQEAH